VEDDGKDPVDNDGVHRGVLPMQPIMDALEPGPVPGEGGAYQFARISTEGLLLPVRGSYQFTLTGQARPRHGPYSIGRGSPGHRLGLGRRLHRLGRVRLETGGCSPPMGGAPMHLCWYGTSFHVSYVLAGPGEVLKSFSAEVLNTTDDVHSIVYDPLLPQWGRLEGHKRSSSDDSPRDVRGDRDATTIMEKCEWKK
jgi:hypothetical protein